MSRIGKQPITLPESVKLSMSGNDVTVEGPLGRLQHCLPNGINCKHDTENRQLVVTRASDSKPHRALHGLTRALVKNMVVGVSEGYKKALEIHGVGYNVKLDGNRLALHVGFANTIVVEVLAGVKVEVTSPTNPGRVIVSGCDKQRVGQVAAQIRAVRPPEPYQGKGIRYVGETIRRKAGKAFVGAG